MKVKGIIFYIALAIILVSCGSDTETTIAPDGPVTSAEIGFSSYVGGDITKGSVITMDNISDFGVYAMYTSEGKQYSSGSTGNDKEGSFTPAFMKNVKVTKATDGSWDYDLHHFWPSKSTEYVSFLAYAPFADGSTNTSIGTTLVNKSGNESDDRTYIKYTITTSSGSSSESSASSTIDLMYNSNNTLNQQYYLPAGDNTYTKTNNVDNGKLQLNFKHATARIGFSITSSKLAESSNFATGATEGTTSITINKLMLLGDNTSATGTPIGAFYQEGYLNLNPAANERWIVSSTSNSNKVYFTFEWSSDNKNKIEATRESGSTGDGAANTLSNDDNGYLFIIPQDFREYAQTVNDETTQQSSNESPATLYCYVNYTVTNGSTPTNKYAYSQIKQNFEAGKAYVIKIDIDPDSNSLNNSNPSTVIQL